MKKLFWVVMFLLLFTGCKKEIAKLYSIAISDATNENFIWNPPYAKHLTIKSNYNATQYMGKKFHCNNCIITISVFNSVPSPTAHLNYNNGESYKLDDTTTDGKHFTYAYGNAVFSENGTLTIYTNFDEVTVYRLLQ